MAQTALYAGEQNGGGIYRIGRMGFDSGTPNPKDLGSHGFDAVMKTEQVSPAGENGLMHFRRVGVRLLKSGQFTITLKVFVDDEQTQVYDDTQSTSPLVDQTVQASESSTALRETVVEASIDAVGTSIAVEISIDSEDLTGLFLVESVTGHGRPTRPAESRSAESE